MLLVTSMLFLQVLLAPIITRLSSLLYMGVSLEVGGFQTRYRSYWLHKSRKGAVHRLSSTKSSLSGTLPIDAVKVPYIGATDVTCSNDNTVQWHYYYRPKGMRTSTDDIMLSYTAKHITQLFPDLKIRASTSTNATTPASGEATGKFKRYLDLGCGIGSTLLLVAYNLGPQLSVGVEIQEQSYQLLRRTLLELPINTATTSMSNCNRITDNALKSATSTCIVALNADLKALCEINNTGDDGCSSFRNNKDNNGNNGGGVGDASTKRSTSSTLVNLTVDRRQIVDDSHTSPLHNCSLPVNATNGIHQQQQQQPPPPLQLFALPFDLITANPPFLSVTSGSQCRDAQRREARFEVHGCVSDYCRTVRTLLRTPFPECTPAAAAAAAAAATPSTAVLPEYSGLVSSETCDSNGSSVYVHRQPPHHQHHQQQSVGGIFLLAYWSRFDLKVRKACADNQLLIVSRIDILVGKHNRTDAHLSIYVIVHDGATAQYVKQQIAHRQESNNTAAYSDKLEREGNIVIDFTRAANNSLSNRYHTIRADLGLIPVPLR